MPPAAILDIDGTLVDTNYQHALAWFRALREHGELLPLWRIHRAIGMGGDQLVATLCGDEVEERKGEDIREAEKERYADYVIDNSGDLGRTRRQVEEVWTGLRSLAAPG